MIDAHQLRYFAAVAKERHFARAADRLGVAQSAVSTQIKRLEQQLGVRLLNRNKRQPISLTEAGRLFLDEAATALMHLERAEQVAMLAARGMAGSVRLGFVATAATSGLLSRILTEFRRTHENVRIDVLSMDTLRQLDAIASGEIDAGIVRARTQYPDGVTATIIHTEPVMVAMSDEHPLASKRVVSASDLKGHALIVAQFNANEGPTETLVKLGSAGGFLAQANYTVHDFISGVNLATAGYGILILPSSMQQISQPGCTFRPISDFTEKVNLAMARRNRESSPAVKNFIAIALSLVTESDAHRGKQSKN
jgi:DNA-binding transcriptional LysR family regulator